MANKNIMETTSNRGVYNKSRKIYLEQKGELHCARCPYHRSENIDSKYYGSRIGLSGGVSHVRSIRYPNWKLVSRNEKQWMKKKIKIKIKRMSYKYFEDYYELFF